ncbi:hypothetical protein GCM10028827_12500 [Mucilaginibacter myungsuensis]
MVKLTADQPNIDTSKLVVTQPTCNKSGIIKGLTASTTAPEQLQYSWKDENGKEFGTNPDIWDLLPGKYILTVTGSASGRTATYGPVTILNFTGTYIDQSEAIVTPTDCGKTVGSITGITASGKGTFRYSWKNAADIEVATTVDLTNQPAGLYTLQVTDDTDCGPVYTSAIQIGELNGITISDSERLITKATCQYNDGSITGIKTTGASSYKWYNSNSATTVVSTQVDLKNAATGSYYLVASNANGCTVQSATYIIDREAPADLGGIAKIVKNASCDLNNGSIEITLQNPPAVLPKSYRWVTKADQQTVATTPGNTISSKLTDLDAGAYDVYTADQSGCESFLAEYFISRIPALSVNSNSVAVTDDACMNSTGSIKGIQATGSAPLTYTWTDEDGTIIGNTLDLTNVKAGTYKIIVTDAVGCTQTLTYTVKNTSIIINAPTTRTIQLCAPGDAFVSVPAELGFKYRLYETANDLSPLMDNATGKFQVRALQSRSYYVSKYSGNCESPKVEVKIEVGVGALSLANAFSPNGDGINDTWQIPNIQNYPKSLVRIFGRAGNMVFNSTGYGVPFDGTYNGNPLPAGIYYYVINLNSGCSALSGSLTIMR